jgi:hypothetical protein
MASQDQVDESNQADPRAVLSKGVCKLGLPSFPTIADCLVPNQLV